MKNNFKIFLLLSLFALLGSSGRAQILCQPSFDNGCTNWYTRSLSIGNISWTAPSDCSVSAVSDTLLADAGESLNATVQSGNWCGIGLWVDFDRNGEYDTTENVFHKYGGSQVHTYQFSFSLPDSLEDGVYPMRLVSGWGTDCYSDGDNGYGACGLYQYGNFQDIALRLPSAVTSLKKVRSQSHSTLPLQTDADGQVLVQAKKGSLLGLYHSDGRLVLQEQLSAQGLRLNLSSLPPGIYRFRAVDDTEVRTATWMKAQ